MVSAQVFVWFSTRAREAFDFYTAIFGATGDDVSTSGDAFFSGVVRAGGCDLVVFNGEPYGEFAFTPSISIYLTCEGQSEVDYYWNALSTGGQPGRCGWLTDPFGLSWQVVPRTFHELMAHPDPGVRERVRVAMMSMDKFDVDALLRASDIGNP